MNSDALAIMRTRLANERTFLAYIRTSMACFATGAGLVHFISSLPFTLIGWVFIALGCFIFLIGIIRFVQVRNNTRSGACPTDTI